MKAFVTGASGFAGQHLLRMLLAAGNQVFGTTESLSQPGLNSDEFRLASWLELDITDGQKLSGALSEIAPDVVFHLAAATFVPQSIQSPVETYRVNFFGTLNLLEAMRQQSRRCRLVFVSSSEVYGAPEYLPIDERHPLAPRTPYAGSKAAADLLCLQYASSFNLDVVRLRPFNHTGPGQSDRFVISSLARQLVEIERGLRPPVLQVGNLESRRDFTDVRDIVRGYIEAVGATRFNLFNLCSGVAVTIREMLDQMLTMTRARNVRIHTHPHRMRKDEIAEVCGSFQRARQQWGWEPRIPLEETLGAVLDNWRGKIDAKSAAG